VPRITIDGRQIECREGISVLQAALEAGIQIPHYCYHPGLSVVASCRLCLMEIMVPNPRTGQRNWSPKLVPACQTPVEDGLVARFDSQAVRDARRHVMEYLLIDHPLDCPVCDQAGECLLQDYSYRFGNATSRMVDRKTKNPKKDIGPHTLLYQDRCILCTRCVRFTREIAGTGELCVVNRGHRCEIDVFDGRQLDNPLQGNVVDLCPVGAMLDKHFLFAQRVWFLQATPSICPMCSAGCAIRIDHNEGRVYRLKPRYNPRVNQWWMCDYGRFGWDYIDSPDRIRQPTVRRGRDRQGLSWRQVPTVVRFRLEKLVREHGSDKLAVQLSPQMACEEAWLLVQFVRKLAPGCTLTLGDVPQEGTDEFFPKGCTESEAKFVIRAEKAPNRRGVELVMKRAGGAIEPREQVWQRAAAGELAGMWLVGGYPARDWPAQELLAACKKLELLILQDMFPSALLEAATIVLPSCAWAEREGSFMNHAGLIQPFRRAIDPPQGAVPDGQVLFELAGHAGVYAAAHVRQMMARQIEAFADVYEPPAAPHDQR